MTITRASPIVDDAEHGAAGRAEGSVITELPAARNIQNIAILIPGMAVGGTLDVGGLRGGAEVNNFSAHGGRADDGRLQLDGMSVGGPTGGASANSGGGGTSYFQPDMGNASELAVTTSGALGEAESGGPVINVIPKSGGNTPSGAFFFSFANSGLQGNNLTDELRAQGIAPGHRGPHHHARPDRVDRRADQSRQAVVLRQRPHQAHREEGADHALQQERRHQRVVVRGRSGASGVQRFHHARRQRPPDVAGVRPHKLNFYYDEQWLKDNHEGGGTATTSPEAAGTADAYPQHLIQTGWQSPWTNRLLLDANFSASIYDYGGREREGNDTRDLVRVTDTGIQSGIQSVTYRSMNWNENHASCRGGRCRAPTSPAPTASKSGYMGFVQEQDNLNFTNTNDISCTFRSGIPQSLTMVGDNPIRYRSRAYSQSAYVQEQWTLSRLTLQGGALRLRAGIYPDQTFGGSRFHPESSTSRPIPRAGSPASTTSTRASA